MKALLASHYFPSLEYFSVIKKCEEVWIESQENFVKQTFRSRCYILTSQDRLSCAIPLIGGNKKTLIKDIKIDYSQKWVNNHWRAFVSAYNKSPYFEYYEAYIHDILYAKHETLFELNNEILTFCLKALNLDVQIKYTSVYEKTMSNELEDFRTSIHPKTSYIYRKQHTPKAYQQMFGDKFAENLSVLDLISCMGPDSHSFL